MEWEVEELCKLGKIQPEILEAAFKELWQRNPALYKSVVINAYLDEKINLGKAAELYFTPPQIELFQNSETAV